jgi:hypothetical protein
LHRLDKLWVADGGYFLRYPNDKRLPYTVAVTHAGLRTLAALGALQPSTDLVSLICLSKAGGY